jgi:hypothetical protein
MTENSAPESEVHLYNEFHNGDIFYSRPLVRLLEKKYMFLLRFKRGYMVQRKKKCFNL